MEVEGWRTRGVKCLLPWLQGSPVCRSIRRARPDPGKEQVHESGVLSEVRKNGVLGEKEGKRGPVETGAGV